jgi:hypothetical protein
MNSTAKLSLALAAALAATSVGAATEYQYTMLFSGQVGGQHVTRIADDGSISTDFSYRDNGRGPDYKERLALAPDGTLQRFAITGKSTFGSLVDEHFERKGERAQWSGKVDRGAMKVSGEALYVPIDSTIEVTGIIARALIQAPNSKLPGIPGGELSIVKIDGHDGEQWQGNSNRGLVCHTRRGS